MEILFLKLSNIDKKNNELHVNRSLQKVAIYKDYKIVRYEFQETTPRTKTH